MPIIQTFNLNFSLEKRKLNHRMYLYNMHTSLYVCGVCLCVGMQVTQVRERKEKKRKERKAVERKKGGQGSKRRRKRDGGGRDGNCAFAHLRVSTPSLLPTECLSPSTPCTKFIC